MALRHIMTVLSDLAIQSSSGIASAVNIYNNLSVPGLPAMKDPFWVIVQMTGDNGDPYRISVEGQELQIDLAEGLLELRAQESPYHQRSAIVASESRPAIFEQEGVYHITPAR